MSTTSAALLRAARAVEDMFECVTGCACGVRKVDVANRSAFDRVVAEISAELNDATIDLQEGFVARAVDLLDVEWGTLTAARREVVIAAAMAILPRPEPIAAATLPVFAKHAGNLIGAALGVDIGEFDVDADPVAQWLRDGNSRFITAAFAVRNEAIAAQARAIVARAIEEGWRRADTAAALERAFGPAKYLGKSGNYWDVVAGVFAGRARTYGTLLQLQESATPIYRIEEVMDEVTCDACRFMHGTTFKTSDGLATYQRMATHPEAVKDIVPFLRTGKDSDGNKILYVADSSGTRKTIATVVRSAFGTADARGAFRTAYDAQMLAAAGICVPPFHGNCRGMVVADL